MTESVDLEQIKHRGYMIILMPPKRVAWIVRNGGVVFDRVECDPSEDVVEVAQRRIDEKEQENAVQAG